MTKSNKITFYLLILLAVFLPFSSWIVSLTGDSSYSLIRDFLVLSILLLSVIPGLTWNPEVRHNWIPALKITGWDDKGKRGNDFTRIQLLVFGLIIWGLASYFWKEASPLQWLRGFRFTFMPLILFLSLSVFRFSGKEKKNLIYIISVEAVLLGIVALLEYFQIKIPMYQNYNATGALNETNFVGNTGIVRLKSIVAGPNALGLYLLAVLGYLFGIKKSIWLSAVAIFLAVILILTFGRSAIIGLTIMFLISTYWYLKIKIGSGKTIVATAVIAIALAIAGYIGYNQPKSADFFTHANSTDMRLLQYQRIWDQREEIGLLGRGMGTAGPSSIDRLDGGPNHWTENIYLDLFEELGLFGILLYLSVIIYLFALQIKNRNKTGILLLSAFSIAGLFINYYNGQVGIYLFWIALVLAIDNIDNKEDI